MQIPVIRGLIDRRILVNYRVRPEVLAKLVPAPFRPKCIDGVGMAGICLIRLKSVRPGFLPGFVGLTSENAAHRIAVEWDEAGETREGVYVPRRDTSSRINTLLGGRLFPGLQSHAKFQVAECNDHFRIELTSDDRQTHLIVEGDAENKLCGNSVFGSLEEASRFFERGSVGYSTTNQAGHFDGLELRSLNWGVRPLDVTTVKSSFFENREFFPAGSVEFDSALLMQKIEHEWHQKKRLLSSEYAPVK